MTCGHKGPEGRVCGLPKGHTIPIHASGTKDVVRWDDDWEADRERYEKHRAAHDKARAA